LNRKFEDFPAVRDRVPLLVGLMGPSGGGKTFSSLRLATGMQKITGGDIYVIDTESRRALHYADQFKFRHLEFTAPFSPLDYLAAMQHCVSQGASILIVDSLSHEHEGPGGVLEWHDQEAERLSNAWKCSRDKANIPAWSEPKAARRKLINEMLQLGVNGLFCFRAKQKMKFQTGKQPTELGWMPIAGEEFLFEMTVNTLLPPAAGGVPQWNPTLPGEKQMIKLPRQFLDVFKTSEPLSEDIGEAMARWASGDEQPKASAPTADDLDVLLEQLAEAPSKKRLKEIAELHKAEPWTDEQRAAIRLVIRARTKDLTPAPKKSKPPPRSSDAPCDHPDGFAGVEDGPDRICVHCGAIEDDPPPASLPDDEGAPLGEG